VNSLATDSVDVAAAEGGAPPRALMKGRQTRAAIVDAALALASHIGIEGLSIGALAEATGMSKSGVFAHFGSREELQISVVREYHARFEEEVFRPAMSEARGLPHVEIEIRQDLVSDDAGQARWARRIARALQDAEQAFLGSAA